MVIAEGIASAVTILSIVAFALYIGSMFRSQSDHRPLIVPTNRFGEPMPPDRNPDYRSVEDETQR
jgi:hypothetical protein